MKKMLDDAKDYLRNERTKAIIESTKGIVFLSTPHLGSDAADWAKYLAGFLTTVNIEELKANAPQLRDLNQWYRQNADELGIKTEVYYETRPTKSILVVDASSANPGIKDVQPTAVEADHDTIAKPRDRYDTTVYFGVKNFIEDCLPLQKALPPGDVVTLQTSVPEKTANPLQPL